MPSVAVSLLSPTVTVTSVALSKRVLPSREAVTVIVWAPSSSPTVPSSTDKVIAVGGSSSSVMVPVAVWSVDERVALVGDDSSTRKVSSGSSITSSVVSTVIVVDVDPAVMVTSVAVVWEM